MAIIVEGTGLYESAQFGPEPLAGTFEQTPHGSDIRAEDCRDLLIGELFILKQREGNALPDRQAADGCRDLSA